LAYFAIRSITLRFQNISTPDRGTVFHRKSLGGVAKDKPVKKDRRAITAVHLPVTYTRHEAGQFDRASYRRPKTNDGAKLHNLPKERYLPAEVNPASQAHMPRRGIELEADYQNALPLSTQRPGNSEKRNPPANRGIFH